MAAPRYAPLFATFRDPWVYSDAETATDLLRQAGFAEVETSLEPALTVLEDREGYSEFVRTAILRLHLEQILDTALRNEFVAELTRQGGADNPPFSLDYWRLNLNAKVPE